MTSPDLYSPEQLRAIVDAIPGASRGPECLELCDRAIRLACAYRMMCLQEENGFREKSVEVRARLRRAVAATDQLIEELGYLDPFAGRMLELGALSDDTCGRDVDLAALREQLASFRESAGAYVTTGHARPRSGRKIPESRTGLMLGLVAIWESYSGQPAGYTYDDNDPDLEARYSGPFITFAEAVARPLLGPAFRRRDFAECVKRRRKAGGEEITVLMNELLWPEHEAE